MNLNEAHSEWLFEADNRLPPAERITRLLEHAARVRPGVPIPVTVIALIAFGLEREPNRKSPYVVAVRQELRKVGRRIVAGRRHLLRLQGSVRASVSAEDAVAVLGPRRVARAQREESAFVDSVRLIRPDALTDPTMRAKIAECLREIPDVALSAEQRAIRDAWVNAATDSAPTWQ